MEDLMTDAGDGQVASDGRDLHRQLFCADAGFEEYVRADAFLAKMLQSGLRLRFAQGDLQQAAREIRELLHLDEAGAPTGDSPMKIELPSARSAENWLRRALVVSWSHTQVGAAWLRTCDAMRGKRGVALPSRSKETELPSSLLPPYALALTLFPRRRLPELAALAFFLAAILEPPGDLIEVATALVSSAEASWTAERFRERFRAGLQAAIVGARCRIDGDRRAESSPRADPASVPTALRITHTKHPRLYHLLLNVEDHPEALVLAHAFLARRLREAGRCLRFVSQPPIASARYDPALLERGVMHQYEKQQISYRDGKGLPFTREETVLGILQMSPACLADGAWLQGVSTYSDLQPEVAAPLARIYSEEIGAGDATANHANIFRKLLDQVGVETPEITDEALVRMPCFSASAFDVPLLWLSIASQTRAFFPELLGLNLFVELDGVGGRYRLVADLLRRHGIDPYTIDLHDRADNPTNGHARHALDAVLAFLRNPYERSEDDNLNALWLRIRTGYAAARIAGIRRSFHLARRLCGPVCRRWLTGPFRRSAA